MPGRLAGFGRRAVRVPAGGGPGLALEPGVGDVAAVGAVGQPFQDGQVQPGGGADREVGAGLADRGEQAVAVEAAVGHDEHAGLQVSRCPGQGRGEGLLGVLGVPGHDGGDGAGAALGQGHHQDLRVGAVAAALGRDVAEPFRVGGGVGALELDPVDGHQPPPGEPGPGGGQLRARHRGPLEQLPQRLAAQPLAGLGQRGGGRHVPFPFPDGQEGKALHQLPHDLFVGIAVEKGEREHEIHHGPRGQQPFPLLPPPRLREHLIDQLTGDQPGQHAQRDPVRQRRPGNLLSHKGTIPGMHRAMKRPLSTYSRRYSCGNVETSGAAP